MKYHPKFPILLLLLLLQFNARLIFGESLLQQRPFPDRIPLNGTFGTGIVSGEQCFVRHHSDPIKFLWSIKESDGNETSFRNITLNITASKMTENFCLAIQLLSERDRFFVPGISENYQMKMPNSKGFTMIENVRYRWFCYFQSMGSLDFDLLPTTLCMTRNNTHYKSGCSRGYANQRLDSFIANAEWNFTLREPFKQFEREMTTLMINIPMLIPPTSEVQLHLAFVDLYSYPDSEPFRSEFMQGASYYIPIVSNLTQSKSPYWDDECNVFIYNSRLQYYYWKMICLSVGIVEFSAILILLFIRRNHHMIKSRFVVPFFSCGFYLAQGVASILLNIIYYDPEWDTLIEELVLIAVLSLHIMQVLRYYASRYFYSRYYSKRDSIILKMLLSKFLFLVAIIVVILCEAVIVTFLMTSVPYVFLSSYYYDSICITVAVLYFSVLGIGLVAHIIVNRRFIQKHFFRDRRRIIRWIFLYDDTFGYNTEFFVLAPCLFFALIHFVVSQIDVSYLTIPIFDYTRPISQMYTNHILGYFLYGVSKIAMTTGFTFQNLFLIIYTFVKTEKPVEDFIAQQEEMDLFLSKSFSDGTVCMDIMKQFLAREFRVELLEMYLFISKNPDALNIELSEKYPQHFFKTNCTNQNTHYENITRDLLEAFGRLKQTVVYEEEYLKKNTDEIEFVFNSIT